jgi:hypothetical protein
MATVPSPAVILGGFTPTGDDWDSYYDTLAFLLNPPVCEVRQSAAQSIANATYVPVTFDLEDWDTDVDGVGGHDTVTNNSRFTARYAGTYQLSGAVGFVANATSTRGATWAVNGTNLNAGQVIVINAGATTDQMVVARTKHVRLAVGDYVQLMAFQFSGGALNTSSGSAAVVQASMSVRWVGL